MAGDVRQRMVLSALYLIAERGVQGTSIADVLERSGAPRGSVYHHFPEGKNQMIDSALDAAGATAIELLDRKAGEPAEDIAAWFLHIWREVLIRADERSLHKYFAGVAALCRKAGINEVKIGYLIEEP